MTFWYYLKNTRTVSSQRRKANGFPYFGIIVSSCLLSTKSGLRFLLICFAGEIKAFYQNSLGNQVDFKNIINVSPNILAKNENFKKLRQNFAGEKALMVTTLISFCYWKTFVHFCLREKRPENVFLTLIMNHCKIGEKNKLYRQK